MSEKIKCLKCGSDQLTADKKGFSGKKAVAGAVLTGGIGLLAGTIGSNKVKITCLACGNSWEPNQYEGMKTAAKSEVENRELAYWKKEFYRLYESGDTEKAEKYYATNSHIIKRFPDMKDGYNHLKSSDKQLNLMILFILGVLGVVIYLIAR